MSVPIVLFVYNRPEKTRQIISAIYNQTIQPARLIVFADAAKNADDEASVFAVREIINSINWVDKQVIVRNNNLGCAANIVQGLNEVFAYNNQAIILEDDTLPSPHFYASLCKLLDRYSSENKVFSVGGYPSIKFNALKEYPYDVIFSKRFSCWGWGTWDDRWNRISRNLLSFRNPFENYGSIPNDAGFDLPIMAKSACDRPGFYWDIPIAITCLKLGFLHALTRYYLINNIGLDSGTHGSQNINKKLLKFLNQNNLINDRMPQSFPEATFLPEVRDAVQEYIRDIYSISSNSPSFKQKLLLLLKHT